jgi:hypothetical protein
LCTKSPKNEPPDEETPEELSPEVESPEEKKVPGNYEISICYINIGEIWDRNKLLSTTYFHFKLLFTLLEVMMLNLNHKLSKNVDIEVIG